MSYPRRHRSHLTDHARVCQCGQAMVRTWMENSGTTRISQACPVIAANGSPWHSPEPLVGHQYVVTSKPSHDPDCCSIRDVETIRKGEIGPLWPFDNAGALDVEVDPADQVRRAVLDAVGNRCRPEDAEARVRLILAAAQLQGQRDATDRAAVGLDLARRILDVRPEPDHNPCGTKHRTHAAVARCMYRDRYVSVKVTGKGPWAVLAWCSRSTVVTLWPTRRAAVRAWRRLEDYGCGGRCKDRHGMRRLPDVDTQAGKGNK